MKAADLKPLSLNADVRSSGETTTSSKRRTKPTQGRGRFSVDSLTPIEGSVKDSTTTSVKSAESAETTELTEPTKISPYNIFKEQVSEAPGVIGDFLGMVIRDTPEGVAATPEVAAEMGLGMISFLPSIAVKMERQAKGAISRMEGVPGELARGAYTALTLGDRPEPETKEETIKAATANSEKVHEWIKKAFYLGMDPELSETAEQSLALAEKGMAAPREYVFEPIGKAYGMAVDDKVAGAMATDALEMLFFFGALPKAHMAAKKRIHRTQFDKAWKRAVEVDRSRKERLAKLKEGKAKTTAELRADRRRRYEEGDVETVFGEAAAREIDDAARARDHREAAEALKSRELLERQKVYDRLFNEKDTLDFLDEVEDFALRRDTGAAGKIDAAELDAKYKAFMERRRAEDLEFQKDWQRWQETKRDLEKNGIQPAEDPFINTRASLARIEGEGARTDLKFGVEAGRPYPQPHLPEAPRVTGETLPTPLREKLGHQRDWSLKKKMALETNRANKRRAGRSRREDPLASGKAEPVGEAPVAERTQGDVLHDMGQEILETRGVKAKEPKQAREAEQGVVVSEQPTKSELEAQTIKAKWLERTERRKESQPEQMTVPAAESDMAIDISKHEARVNLIKERAERLKAEKYRHQVEEKLDSAKISEDLKEAYRDMLEKDPETVDAAISELSGKKPVNRELQLIDDIQSFQQGEHLFYPEDSFFIENMRNDTIRSLDDIVSDLQEVSSNLLRSERGSFDWSKLSGEQAAAVQRLTKDLQTIVRNAGRAGKSIRQYLVDLKITDPETAAVFEKYADDYVNRDKIEVRVDKAKGTTARKGDGWRIIEMMEESKKAKRAKYKKSLRDYVQTLRKAFPDRSPSVLDTLEGTKSKSAEKVYNDFVAVAGAGPKAKRYFETARDKIYSHLTHKEADALDTLIFATKELDISNRHAFRKHPGKTIAADYHAFMQRPKEYLGLSEESFRRVNQAARDYFDVFKDILELKRQNGAIPDWLYELLKENSYSPSRWLHMIDGHTWSTEYGGSLSRRSRPPTTYEEFVQILNKDVSEAGPNMGPKTSTVERLRGGAEGYQEINSQYLLANAIGETHRWIAKNKASKSLADYVKAAGDGAVLKNAEIKKWATDEGGVRKPVYKRPPKGYKEIFYFENGQRKAVWAQDKFASEWRSSGSEFRHKYAGLVRAGTGSAVTREFATGSGNPFFFMKGLPMDLLYTDMAAMYKTADGKYKSLHGITLPQFAYSMGKNMAKVAPDVFLRKGRYIDYINEYGGFNALTETGGSAPKARGKIAHGVQTLRDWASYMNRSAEFWVRIANREKYIERGYSPEQASIMARRVLDFHQGGEFAKFMDNAIPYTNVAVQGMRGMFGSARKNPGEFAIKAAQVGGLASANYMYNIMKHREAYEQESDYNKKNFFIMPTGFSLTDARGNEHHVNIKIRKDPETRAVAALGELVTAAAMGEETDFKRLLMTVKDSVPYIETAPLPPYMASILTYVTNTDMMTLEKVWKGQEAGVEEWYHDRTSQLYRDVAKSVGLSPERFRASVEAVITRDSLPAKLMGSAYDAAFRELPKEQQENFVAQFILDNWASDAISVTSETTKYREEFEDIEKEEVGKRLAQNRLLDSYARGYYKDGDVEWEQLYDVIANAPTKQDQERLMTRLKHYVETMNLPDQNMWLSVGSAGSGRAKGRKFYEWWSDLEGEDKRRVEESLFMLKNSSSGIVPKNMESDFWQTFYRLRGEEADSAE